MAMYAIPAYADPLLGTIRPSRVDTARAVEVDLWDGRPDAVYLELFLAEFYDGLHILDQFGDDVWDRTFADIWTALAALPEAVALLHDRQGEVQFR